MFFSISGRCILSFALLPPFLLVFKDELSVWSELRFGQNFACLAVLTNAGLLDCSAGVKHHIYIVAVFLLLLYMTTFSEWLLRKQQVLVHATFLATSDVT